MNLQQQDNSVQLFPFVQQSFAGGINTAVPNELVGDTEAVDILNFEYADDDDLYTRPGINEWSTEIFPSRITSLHYYENEDGDISILATSKDKLYASPNFNPVWDDITASLNLPDNKFWMWRNWQGYAIGVSHGADGNPTAAYPIKFDGTTASVLANAPRGKYLEVWNERLWLVSAEDPNVIYGSALGNPENWTVDGADDAVIIDVGKNDGDKITGIYAFRGQLFIFKRTKIYTIKALDGTIPTDVGNLYVDLYTSNIGCVSQYTIQAILDDVLFLSDSGVASLANAPLGELKTALISQKVKGIKTILKNSLEISSLVIEKANQYWLMVPSSMSANGESEIFVFDIRRIQEGFVRWVRFNGLIAGTVACSYYVNGIRNVLIGSTDRKVYEYIPGLLQRAALWDEGYWDISAWDDDINANTFLDGTESIHKIIKTKTYNLNAPFIYKLFSRWGINVSLISDDVLLEIAYQINKNPLRGGTYNLQFNRTSDLSLWDVGFWDVSDWDGERTVTEDLAAIRQFFRDKTRKGTNVTFKIENKQNRGFVIKDILLQVAPLNHKRVNDIGVI